MKQLEERVSPPENRVVLRLVYVNTDESVALFMTTPIVYLALFMAAMAVAAEGDLGLVGISSVDTARLTAYYDDDALATPSTCESLSCF